MGLTQVIPGNQENNQSKSAFLLPIYSVASGVTVLKYPKTIFFGCICVGTCVCMGTHVYVCVWCAVVRMRTRDTNTWELTMSMACFQFCRPGCPKLAIHSWG